MDLLFTDCSPYSMLMACNVSQPSMHRATGANPCESRFVLSFRLKKSWVVRVSKVQKKQERRKEQ